MTGDGAESASTEADEAGGDGARVVAHYEAQLARHGPTARGMDWKDEASQRLRFDVLKDVCDLDGLTVHEVGCGAGHLCDHLLDRGVRARYSGSDASAEMVDTARRLHPGISFERHDVRSVLSHGPYDVVLGSGLFHVKLDTPEPAWRRFVETSVQAMFDACRVAIAFNAISDRVDFRSAGLFYTSPAAMLDFCLENLSRHVLVRHDYPLYEYTVYVRREAASV